MNFIKNIIEGKADEAAHKQLARYGKGEYERALIKVKKGKNNFNVKTSFEFANDFVGIIAGIAKGELEVSGKIIANYDFDSELKIEHEFSKRGKLYTAEIKTNMPAEQLKEIYEKFKLSFILLNINGDGIKLSVKNSLPKPGGTIKDNFCKASLPLSLLNEFAFDVKQNFNELEIKHIFVIDELVVPDEYKNDFVKAREFAKRKGKLIRNIALGGKLESKSYNLLV